MSEIKDRLTFLYGLVYAIVPLPEVSQTQLELDVAARYGHNLGMLGAAAAALRRLFPMALPSPKQSSNVSDRGICVVMCGILDETCKTLGWH